MKKLAEFFALDKVDGDLGIEIEVEGHNLPHVADKYWVTKDDHSLRGGLEYVFATPRPLKQVPTILKLLNKTFEAHGARPDFSFRTSVHVHLNVQQLTYDQILNIMYTYLLVEGAMFNFCDERRSCNRFCLRLQDAEGILPILKNMCSARDKDGLRAIPADRIRYFGLNLEALSKFGSVEFRSLEGTIDTERITRWCKMIVSIRDYAMGCKNIMEVHDNFVKRGAEQMLKDVFGDLCSSFDTKYAISQMQFNYSLSLELPFVFKAAMEALAKKAPEKKSIAWVDLAVHPDAIIQAAPVGLAPVGLDLMREEERRVLFQLRDEWLANLR